jgi:hypothetical protein
MGKLSKREKLKHCVGCRSNYYNHPNKQGVKECWHLENAKLENREIYYSTHQIKPTKVRTLYCFYPRR